MAESEGDFLNAAICVTAPPVFVPRFGEIICGGKKDFSEEDAGEKQSERRKSCYPADRRACPVLLQH